MAWGGGGAVVVVVVPGRWCGMWWQVVWCGTVVWCDGGVEWVWCGVVVVLQWLCDSDLVSGVCVVECFGHGGVCGVVLVVCVV